MMKKIATFLTLFVLFAFANSALAAAPVVTLQAASNITETSATLSAVITSSSALDNIFEYGTDPSFGSNSKDVFTTSKSINISGLNPGTTYYYRILSSNADGTTIAPILSGGSSYLSFKTLSNKTPTYDTLGVEDITETGAKLTGRVNSQGLSGTYHFRYYAGASCGSYLGNTTTASLGAQSGSQYVSSVVSGLSAGQKYCSQLVVKIGNEEYVGSKVSFTSKSQTNNNNNNSCTIISFYPSVNPVNYGSSTSLLWTTSNCNSLSISSIGSVNSSEVNSGSRSVTIYGDTVYTINASGSNGTSDSRSISVSLANNNPPPLINNYQYPTCYYNGTCTCTSYYSCTMNNTYNPVYNNNTNNYTYNPHTPEDSSPNYITRGGGERIVYKTITLPGGTTTQVVDTVATNNVNNYQGTDLMAKYANAYYDYQFSNQPSSSRTNLTGSVGNTSGMSLIGLLVFLIVVSLLVFMIRHFTERKK